MGLGTLGAWPWRVAQRESASPSIGSTSAQHSRDGACRQARRPSSSLTPPPFVAFSVQYCDTKRRNRSHFSRRLTALSCTTYSTYRQFTEMLSKLDLPFPDSVQIAGKRGTVWARRRCALQVVFWRR